MIVVLSCFFIFYMFVLERGQMPDAHGVGQP